MSIKTGVRATTTEVNMDGPMPVRRGRRREWVSLALGLLTATAGSLAMGSAAEAAGPPPGAKAGIESFSTEVKDRVAADETRAGAHPFSARAKFRLNTYDTGEGDQRAIRPIEDPKTILTKLPPGFSGNPQIADQCPLIDVPRAFLNPMRCPDRSVVGFIFLDGDVQLSTPIVNVIPERGYPAEFGFSEGGFVFTLYPELRSDGDYGLDLKVGSANNDAIRGADVTFCSWGVESTMRIAAGASTFRCREQGEAQAFEKPFLTNPSTECTSTAPVTRLEIDTYANPGVFDVADFASPLITGCDKLTFDPSVTVTPTTTQPDAPSGLNVDMAFPQEDNAEGQAPPALKKAVVTLPEGMTINPTGAHGLEACTDAGLQLKSKAPVSCPGASKIGTVTAKSPLMKETLTGGVYIRSQNSDDPESGEMFRLGLVLENEERGISVRLPGSIRADKSTGRLVTTFDNNPELPVSDISLKFKDGPRGPLATPPTCGQKTTDITLTSWGKQTVSRQSSFTVDCTAGLGAFGPAFAAGTDNPTAGAASVFNLQLNRPDRQDVLAGLKLEMPTGLLAKVKGNLGTRIGHVDVAAGPGSQPFWLRGNVFLEGPYGDAPFSLRVVVPAKAGPFDLGEVVVRQKIYIDPIDAHVTVVSDPVPIIVKGVPVRLRALNVSVDKAGFMINPTSCEAKSVGGTLGSGTGQTAAVSARFQVGACEKLDVNPDLDLTFAGKGQTKDGQHPSVDAKLVQKPGHANLRKVKTTLPLSVALDPDNAQALCEFVDGTKVAPTCPAGSIVGKATAVTPLLDEPLTGPVYFVKNVRKDPKSGREIKTLPKLVIPLKGQGVALTLTGTSDAVNDRLVTTFDNVPDAPVSAFDLHIDGGKNGILAVTGGKTASICKQSNIAIQGINGQNGKGVFRDSVIATPDCPYAVISKSLSAKRVQVKVGGLKAGKLTLSGPGLRRTVRTVKSDTVMSVTVARTAAGRKAKSHRVTASFVAAGQTKARTVKVTVKKAAAKKKATKKKAAKRVAAR
jgi:hypothetical protein